MKWCRFKSGDQVFYGIIEGDTVTEVSGSPFDSYMKTSNTHPLSSVKLEVPLIPRTFYAAGINYRDHITMMAARRGEEPVFPPHADVNYRGISALTAHEEPIIVPRDATELLQYEGELAVVIGKYGKHIPEAEALDYVFGYTIGNDVSERTWQRSDRTNWRAKNCDTFNPMGPWIVTGLDPDTLHVTVRLNDRVVAEYDVKDAIFSIRHYISRISKYMALYPSDILWMGTDGEPENMKDGDICEIEVNDIGVLRNPVQWER